MAEDAMKLYTCPQCDTIFTRLCKLEAHSKEHLREKTEDLFSSDTDSLSSESDDENLTIIQNKRRKFISKISPAIFRNHGKGIKQPIGKIFEVNKSPDQKQKNFACQVCGQKFQRLPDLKIHDRVHTGDRPYVCKICKKSFTQSSALNTHIRIHTGEKPYQCKICLKQFRESSKVTRHMRVHTGVKPYTCKLCKKSFTQSGSLKVHLKLHDKHGIQYRGRMVKSLSTAKQTRKIISVRKDLIDKAKVKSLNCKPKAKQSSKITSLKQKDRNEIVSRELTTFTAHNKRETKTKHEICFIDIKQEVATPPDQDFGTPHVSKCKTPPLDSIGLPTMPLKQDPETQAVELVENQSKQVVKIPSVQAVESPPVQTDNVPSAQDVGILPDQTAKAPSEQAVGSSPVQTAKFLSMQKAGNSHMKTVEAPHMQSIGKTPKQTAKAPSVQEVESPPKQTVKVPSEQATGNPLNQTAKSPPARTVRNSSRQPAKVLSMQVIGNKPKETAKSPHVQRVRNPSRQTVKTPSVRAIENPDKKITKAPHVQDVGKPAKQSLKSLQADESSPKQTAMDSSGQAIGDLAKHTDKGSSGQYIGNLAKQTIKGSSGQAITNLAKQTAKGSSGHAIGNLAKQTAKESSGHAIENLAKQTAKGSSEHAIGNRAKQTAKGSSRQAIGKLTKQTAKGSPGQAVENPHRYAVGNPPKQADKSPFGQAIENPTKQPGKTPSVKPVVNLTKLTGKIQFVQAVGNPPKQSAKGPPIKATGISILQMAEKIPVGHPKKLWAQVNGTFPNEVSDNSSPDMPSLSKVTAVELSPYYTDTTCGNAKINCQTTRANELSYEKHIFKVPGEFSKKSQNCQLPLQELPVKSQTPKRGQKKLNRRFQRKPKKLYKDTEKEHTRQSQDLTSVATSRKRSADISAPIVSPHKKTLKNVSQSKNKETPENEFYFTDDGDIKCVEVVVHTSDTATCDFEPLDIKEEVETEIESEFYEPDIIETNCDNKTEIQQSLVNNTPSTSRAENSISEESGFQSDPLTQEGSSDSLNHQDTKDFPPLLVYEGRVPMYYDNHTEKTSNPYPYQDQIYSYQERMHMPWLNAYPYIPRAEAYLFQGQSYMDQSYSYAEGDRIFSRHQEVSNTVTMVNQNGGEFMDENMELGHNNPNLVPIPDYQQHLRQMESPLWDFSFCQSHEMSYYPNHQINYPFSYQPHSQY